MRVILLYIFISFGNLLFSCNIDASLKKTFFFERYCMKAFFDQAVKHDQAAHVLYFDNKPACRTGSFLSKEDKTFKDRLSLKGWNSFKKNEHLFPHPNFIFSEYILEDGDDFKILHIYLINKRVLKSCLTRHKTLFQEILGPGFSSEEFISQLEFGCSLPSLLYEDEMLLGIILGYGEESAQAFKEVRKKCTNFYAPPPTETYQRIDLKRPENCKIHPVVFMGNPNSPEVRELVSTYEQELQEIWPIYNKSKKPLKTVLEKLCESRDQ